MSLVVALLALAYLIFDNFQRHMVFLPTAEMKQTPLDLSLAFSDQWMVAPAAGSVDKGPIHGWWLPAGSNEAPAVLYLHGNEDTISTNVDAIARLRKAGFAVLAVDYRGYGTSLQEMPDEGSVYADAMAAWTRLGQLAPKARRHILYGHSLGSAIAIDLATRANNVDALVVEGSFTSVKDMVRAGSPTWAPWSLFVTQRFASDDKVGRLTVPKLFIHCVNDEVIPLKFEERLYWLAAEPKSQLLIPGGNHEHCADFGGAAWLQAMHRIGGLAPGGG